MLDISIQGGRKSIYFTPQKNEVIPLFKGEKSKDLKTSRELQRATVYDVFSQFAEAFDKTIVRKPKLKKGKCRATIFYHVGNTVGLTEEEVRQKIEDYVKANREKVLYTTRQICKKTGLSIDYISKNDFLRLLSSQNPQYSSLARRILKKEQPLAALNLANIVLVPIIAEVFKINVTLSHISITHDTLFTQGIAIEDRLFKAGSSKNSKNLDLMEGWALMTDLTKNPAFYHMSPFALVDIYPNHLKT